MYLESQVCRPVGHSLYASSSCLQVLPQGHNRQQKVAVGDTSGVLQCFSLKRNDVVAAFKTLPTGSAVTHVTLGKGQAQRDKIFVASGHTVGCCELQAST